MVDARRRLRREYTVCSRTRTETGERELGAGLKNGEHISSVYDAVLVVGEQAWGWQSAARGWEVLTSGEQAWSI